MKCSKPRKSPRRLKAGDNDDIYNIDVLRTGSGRNVLDCTGNNLEVCRQNCLYIDDSNFPYCRDKGLIGNAGCSDTDRFKIECDAIAMVQQQAQTQRLREADPAYRSAINYAALQEQRAHELELARIAAGTDEKSLNAKRELAVIGAPFGGHTGPLTHRGPRKGSFVVSTKGEKLYVPQESTWSKHGARWRLHLKDGRTMLYPPLKSSA